MFLIAVFAVIWKKTSSDFSGTPSNIQSASFVPIIDSTWGKKIEDALSKPINYYIHNNKIGTVVKPGDSFLSIFSDFKIPLEKSNEVYKLLKPLGLKAIYPGDSIEFVKSVSGAVEKFSLRSKSMLWYNVSWNDTAVQVEKKPVETSNYTCLLNGVLTSSLSEQMYECGVSDVITSKFADIFAWDINFFTDPRKGDVFQIVFEQKFAEGKKIGYGDILSARYISETKTFYAFGFRDSDGTMKYYDEFGKAVQKQFLKAPLHFLHISSGFTYHRRHPVLGIVRPHLGIDYAAPTGTPVAAAADGKVSFAGWKGGFGNMIAISHGGAYETTYGHLSRILVRSGSYVKQSQTIGTVGSTGISTGPHLDYRMKKGAQFVNPNTIVLPSKEAISSDQMNEFEKVKVSQMIIFEKRFLDKIGLQIVHITTPEINDVVIHQVARNTGSKNVDTPGN